MGAQINERRAKRMSQRMLGVERDPRVPPTQWEVAMDSVRSAWADSLHLLRSLPQKCRVFPAAAYANARRRCETLLRPIFNRLQSFGFSVGLTSTRDLKKD